jgi:hypothetical protein
MATTAPLIGAAARFPERKPISIKPTRPFFIIANRDVGNLAPASPLRHIRNQQEFSKFEIDGKRVGRQA